MARKDTKISEKYYENHLSIYTILKNNIINIMIIHINIII